jgi:hypothetical protein
MNSLVKTLKSIRQLGPGKLWRYGLYQFGLRSGHYRRMTPNRRSNYAGKPSLAPIGQFPEVTLGQINRTLSNADEILQSKIRLFGGPPVPLDLDAGASPLHWTKLERIPTEGDIKLIWEPGRFGWAITLARAYAFSGESKYAREFWDKTLHFLEVHPPNLGRQWQSAQEVAIRLMALVFCDRVLASSPKSTLANRQRLWQAVAEHAQRIPPTLVYARAQNNNHLSSEAAGLYTAGIYLADHPEAAHWKALGWRWLNWGFQHQINEFGTYVQNSTNYHRLMLQLALFTDWLRRDSGEPDWPGATRERFAAAASWLWALTDPQTGAVPNLGANDGAYIFPLTSQPFNDFRPVVNAAARAFLEKTIPKFNLQNEMSAWFGLTEQRESEEKQPQAQDVPRVESGPGRAFLHAAHFNDRPSHADQLHVDLWWQGVNVARDAGTYLYNAVLPWDNALATAFVHNTLTLDGQDQMVRAGRFLWLDWAQAKILIQEVDEEGDIRRIVAEHNGYRHLGAVHQRTLEATRVGWRVTDAVLPVDGVKNRSHEVRISWLLPGCEWEALPESKLHITGPSFHFDLQISGVTDLGLVRAGECLLGNIESDPTWGWFSPTYSVKQPALMVIATASSPLPIEIITEWKFNKP